MNNTEKMFCDGVENVRLTDGVFHMGFYNIVRLGAEDKKVPAGEVVLSQPQFLRLYGAMTNLMEQLEKAGVIKRKAAEPGKASADAEPASPNFE